MNTKQLIDDDHRFLWHPFTQASEWESYQPLVIERGEGFFLIDSDGRRYIDGVSSLWCNVHGHGHPKILEALHAQLNRLQHSTMLGLSHAPGIELARRLVELTPAPLTRVFYSDSGSTSVEVALRMAFQFQRQAGAPQRTRFVTLSEAYHGDTIGSVSLGFSEPFHRGYEPVTFRVSKFDPPFLCDPISGRARCEEAALEAAGAVSLARLRALLEQEGDTVAAVVMEPLVQGAAGIWPQPALFVRGVRELCHEFGCLLVCDEVATGFGRTGTMFAVEQTGICPDILCLAKGITGGYLPLAATLATERVFEAFAGKPSEYRALFHGHTYGGNPMGCAAAIANLDVFRDENTLQRAANAATTLAALLDEHIEPLACSGPVRRVGLMVGFDLFRDSASGERFPTDERRAHRATLLAREDGLVVRPLGDTMVLMPPLSMDDALLERLVVGVANAVKRATQP